MSIKIRYKLEWDSEKVHLTAFLDRSIVGPGEETFVSQNFPYNGGVEEKRKIQEKALQDLMKKYSVRQHEMEQIQIR